MPYEDSPVSDPPSGYSYSGNALVQNSQPVTASAPWSSPSAAASYVDSNNLVTSAMPMASSGNAGAFVSGAEATDVMGGSSSSGNNYSPLSQPQQEKLISTATELGANPADLYAVIAKETGGSFSPAQPGPGGEIGLIQFSRDMQKKYGVKEDQSFDEQMDAAAKYLKDRGWKPGMSVAHMYSIINAGSLRKDGEPRWNYRNRAGTIREHVSDIQKTWYPKSAGDQLETSQVPLPTPRPDRPMVIEPLSEGIADVIRLDSLTPGTRQPLQKGAGYELAGGDPAVRSFQEILKERGYYRGAIDGKYGNQTASAVRAVRRDMGLPDGKTIDEDLAERLGRLGRLSRGEIKVRPQMRPGEETEQVTEPTTGLPVEPATIDPTTLSILERRASRVIPEIGNISEINPLRPRTEVIPEETLNNLRHATRRISTAGRIPTEPMSDPWMREGAPAVFTPTDSGYRGQGPGRSPSITKNALTRSAQPSFTPIVPPAVPAPVSPSYDGLGQLGQQMTPPDIGEPRQVDAWKSVEDEELSLAPVPAERAKIYAPGPLQGIRQFLVDQGIVNESIMGPEVEITLKGNGEILVGKSTEANVSAVVPPIGATPVEPAAIQPPVYEQPAGSVPAGERVAPEPKELSPTERSLRFMEYYQQVPPGSIYVDPNGVTRRKAGGGKRSAVEGRTQVASAETGGDFADFTTRKATLDRYLENGVIDPQQYLELLNSGASTDQVPKPGLMRIPSYNAVRDMTPRSSGYNIMNALPEYIEKRTRPKGVPLRSPPEKREKTLPGEDLRREI